MVAAFPIAKLGILVIKQISKPIAKTIADRARASPFFRNNICIPIANLFHWYEVRIRMKALNLGNVKSVPKLNEKSAIETGAQLLSEIIIFTVASGLLVLEVRRQSEKEEAKQEQIQKEKRELEEQILNLEVNLEKQSAQIRELTKIALTLQNDVRKWSIKRLYTPPPTLPKELEEEEEEENLDRKKPKDICSNNSDLVVDAVNYIFPSDQYPDDRRRDDDDDHKELVLLAVDHIFTSLGCHVL